MNYLNVIVWLFPVIFMIHDFEEIIITGAWRKRYKKAIDESKMKKVPFADFKSTSSFSCAVAEEFIIFSVVALLSCYFKSYVAWYGLFFGIVFHFAIHFILSIQFKHYTPGLLTSILFLPIGIYIQCKVTRLEGYNWQTILLAFIAGFLIILANVVFMHKMMSKFNNWLTYFSFPLKETN